MIRSSIYLIGLFFITSCGDNEKIFPKTTFEGPFPKRNRDLSNIIGERLIIKSGGDTLTLKVIASKKFNLLINEKTGDTLFKGTVSQFRGHYYFNQQLNDTSYRIYTVKFSDNLIYGLNTGLEQTLLVDRAIEGGKYSKLVKYIASDKIRLHSDKWGLKNLFSSIIDSIPPDTILHFEEAPPTLTDAKEAITKIDPEDFEFFSKVYPNPTTDFVNIELQQRRITPYQLADINGKIVLQGQLLDTKNRIDLNGQTDGIYSLTLFNTKDNTKETVKVIKAN
jgi:hypothetical protein